MSSSSFNVSAVDSALRDLRERVLFASLTVLAVAAPGVSAVILLQAVAYHDLDSTTLFLCLYTLVFPVLRLAAARLSYSWSAFALLALLLLTTFLVAWRGGVAVGNVSLSVMVLLLGTLFFGRRGAVFGLTGVVAVFAIAGWLVATGLAPPIAIDMWDPRGGRFWFRQTVAMALFGAAIAIKLVYIVEKLLHQTLDARRLAEVEHQQRLALEAAEREREHEREQRLLAQRALEESRRTEAIARLSGGIAHDFNNALTVIIGSADMARWKLNSPEEMQACLHDIMQAANGAAELTRQLLTLGRRQVSKPEVVSSTAVLKRLHSAFRRVLPSDIELLVTVCDDDMNVHVDPAQLERALLNLVLNARDAMPCGGHLSIVCRGKTLERKTDRLSEGDYVMLAVSDTGRGMDEETLQHIFEPFFTTKTVGSGSGLGLATVYAFAAQAGGDIQVESVPGQGSTFSLFLPRHVAAVHAADVAATATASPVQASGRILVVEDRNDVRDSIVRILAAGGYDVEAAADTDAALQLLNGRDPFALLCIDGIIPGAGSAAVIERVSTLSPSTRVLLCSGYIGEDLLRRGIEAGRYAFIAKPFSAAQLLDCVRQLLLPAESTHSAIGHGDRLPG